LSGGDAGTVASRTGRVVDKGEEGAFEPAESARSDGVRMRMKEGKILPE